ncbi:acetyl-CoA-benzylalcohol acetyltransferase-like [Punica granatum]|uniref:Acetyl-CoA-benzylalcohol acetyltransferase-like n=2 Tax=Punica granatum TaxID=22663 RepID=A0A6P8EEG6_PUNGR|nr:acetyl-CoA-benzylalcohol acetyltransferase-like [Punica granatum]XP_031403791.1 acetyl-CoA-benzylalcohol acetyltransferase-like [Punica granatum]OWM71840.1 hypothetical protein CDL15_Pgr017723 [Punica granatum]PKI59514.1 hypothetical protein CRG98_020042 [Punica granatum]
MEVHVEYKKLVKPSSPTPSHLRKLKLSFVDQYQPPHYPGIIFYYDGGQGDVGSVSTKIHRLEESLSETLTIFYPLAGRNGADGNDFVIDCNDQGVQFVVAKVNRELGQHLLDDIGSYTDMLLARPAFPTGAAGRSSLPLLAIQVNVFECGGLAIAVQFNHVLTDMSSICMFLSAWAITNREGILKAVHPSFDAPSLFPLKDYSFLPPIWSMENPKLRLKRFVFNGEALSRLRAKITARRNDNEKRPSRVELITALISSVLLRIDRAKRGQLRPLFLVHVVNFRTKTQLSIPENTWGNMFLDWCSPPTVLPENESVSELSHTLFDWFREGLMDIIDRLGKVKDPEELRLLVATTESGLLEQVDKGDANLAVMFTSWCNFPVYSIDFGWGPPTLASASKYGLELAILMDTKTGDGVEAWMTLEEDNMHQFERDPDILAYASQS